MRTWVLQRFRRIAALAADPVFRWTLIPGLLILLATLASGRHAGPLLLASAIYYIYVIAVLLAIRESEIFDVASGIAILFLVLSGIALFPASCASFPSSKVKEAGEYQRKIEQIFKQANTERRELSAEENSIVRQLQDEFGRVAARHMVSASVWQFSFVALAWGVVRGGSKRFMPAYFWQQIDNRTNLSLATLAVVVGAVVIVLKLAFAWLLAEGGGLIGDSLDRVAVSLMEAENKDTLPSVAEVIRKKVENANFRAITALHDVGLRAAITIWELVLVLSGLLYIAITKFERPPSHSVSRWHGVRLRLEAGSLAAAGSLSVLFTVLRIATVLRFWDVPIRWTY